MHPGWEDGRRVHRFPNVAARRLRELTIRERWARYPQLGPLPECFQRFGAPPATLGERVGLALEACFRPEDSIFCSRFLLDRLR